MKRSGLGFGLALLSLSLVFTETLAGQESTTEEHYVFESSIPYRTEKDTTEYMKDRCRLDLYYPHTSTTSRRSSGFMAVV